MILNLSNHPHENWQEKQLRAARAYGDVIDLPFPPVSPRATGEELEQTALRLLRQIRRPRRQTGRTEKCFSPGEQNTGSRPFSGLTAGVGIL